MMDSLHESKDCEVHFVSRIKNYTQRTVRWDVLGIVNENVHWESPDFTSDLEGRLKWAVRVTSEEDESDCDENAHQCYDNRIICKLLARHNETIQVMVHFRLLDEEGVTKEVGVCTGIYKPGCLPLTFKTSIAWDKETRIDTTEHSLCNTFLLSHTLRIAVDIFFNKVPLEICSEEVSAASMETTGSLLCDLEALYDSKNYSDVIIKIDKVQFKSHKTILSSRSSVLAYMIEETKDDSIELGDVTPEVFTRFLRFLYTDEVDLGGVSHEMLVLAHRTQVEKLRLRCEAELLGGITVDNWAKTLALAELYDLQILRAEVLDFVSEKIKSIQQSADWEGVIKKYPDFIADLFTKIVK